MAAAFVKSFKRDWVYLKKLENAYPVLAQLPSWFEDDKVHPHRGLRMTSICGAHLSAVRAEARPGWPGLRRPTLAVTAGVDSSRNGDTSFALQREGRIRVRWQQW